jgi:nitric oxide reductase NorE protein
MTASKERAGHVPGQPDMWAFALFELLLFGSYFAVYLVGRTQHPALFLRSQQELDFVPATLNTLVLLTSSWTMARCVQAFADGELRVATRNAWLTVLLGLSFLVSKVVGWITLRNAGHGVTENEFFTHYYFLTGIHVLHLLIGLLALAVLIWQLRSPARRSGEVVETCAVYWHTVDLFWVLIFSVLYVVR